MGSLEASDIAIRHLLFRGLDGLRAQVTMEDDEGRWAAIRREPFN
jgi:hypothetical protein